MPRSPFRKRSASAHDVEPRIRLWCLRLVLRANGYQEFFNHGGYKDDDLAAVCGLPLDEESEQLMTPRQVRQIMEGELNPLEAAEPGPEPTTAANISYLAECLGFGPVEQDLVGFLLECPSVAPLELALDMALDASRGRLEQVLAIALNTDSDTITQALAPKSPLLRAGLISISERIGPQGIPDIELLPGLRRALRSSQMSDAAFAGFFTDAVPATVTAHDMPHLQDSLEHLRRLLQAAVAERQPGVNILLYGPPGTGKTEFARLLARTAGLTLKEISHESETAEPLPPRDRLTAWHLCQGVLASRQDTIVLFDEIEDAFHPPNEGVALRRSANTGGKAWLNQRLESNPLPSIWIANDLEGIDTAHRRRFQFLLEIGPPPRDVRRRIVDRCCEGAGVSEQWRERVAGVASVTPAQLRQVARLGILQDQGIPQAEVESLMTDQLSRHMELQGGKGLGKKSEPPMPWSADLVEADARLPDLITGLRRSGAGSLLLFGPPGTGKTAFARHLAEALQRPLERKAASDLLHPYVGMTEQRIAGMFREAEQSGSVLLLDEADSLLRSRDQAQASWEVTQVNELLTGMEDFAGIFLCATNHLSATDHAALRRFDAKVEFAYPTPDRRWRLFLHLLATLDLAMPDRPGGKRLRQALDRLNNLAPGDFATIARRHQRLGARFRVDELIDALAAESQMKPDAPKRVVGFV